MMHEETIASLDETPFLVGVDLGGTQLRVAVLQGARLLSRVGWSTGSDTSPSNIISRISDAIQLALHQVNIQMDQILGIGIGVPGPVDHRSGMVFTLTNLPGWEHVPLSDLLAQKLATKVPIFVENDANSAGLGEYLFGAGRGYTNIIYLTLSTGIGSCIIVDGNVVRGVCGAAGELGHITIDWQGELCNCGNIGCLESIASGTAIAKRAQRIVEMPEGAELRAFAHKMQESSGEISEKLPIDAKLVALAANAKVLLASEIITRAAQGLGFGLVSIIHSFNPELIILGGGLTQMGALLIDPAQEIIQKRAMKASRDAARIVLAQFGEDVGLIGASALAYYSRKMDSYPAPQEVVTHRKNLLSVRRERIST